MTTINTKGLAPFELRKWQKKAIEQAHNIQVFSLKQLEVKVKPLPL